MTVDSYPELFTTMFGWHFYDIIWDSLSDTGIVYIPFIVILVRNWIEPAKGGDFGNIWSLSLKRMEIEFYLAIFVAIIAGSPAMTLQANILTYDPSPTLVNAAPAQATIGAPQSTYGSNGSFAGMPGQVGIPIWWYTVLTISKGLNHAIVTGMPTAVGIRQIQQQAQLATIADPKLRQEAAQFFNDCYVPARSTYLREKPGGGPVVSVLNEYGQDDPEWMGSHLYRTLYYPSMRAQRRVVGWAYDANRDRNYDPAIAHNWGQPTCKEWWEDSSKGLRKKLKDEADGLSSLGSHLASATTALAGWFPSLTNAGEKQTDWTVRATLSNSRVDAMQAYRPDDFGTYNREGFGHITGAVSDTANSIGAFFENIGGRTKMNAIKPVLPLIQALILMAIYALLPLIVVLSSYSLSMVVIGAIGIFTVNFWTVLWKIGQWADENITLAMHPGNMDGLLMMTSGRGTFGMGDATTAVISDTMLAVFMIGLPLLWSAMMAWIGVNAFRALSTDVIAGGTQPAQDAGDKGGGMVQKVATGGIKKLK